jgi:hypothetical protein
MGKRARVRVLLGAAGAVALLAAACTPAPPTPNTDYQMFARDPNVGAALPCADTPGPVLFELKGVGQAVGYTAESVDGIVEHVATFTQGAGFDILGVTNEEVEPGAYSIVVLFRMSQLGGFDRLLDFKSGTADSGVYMYNGSLRFWPHSSIGSKVIVNGEWAQVVVTRTAGGTQRGFVDGVQQWQFTDTAGDGVISNNRLVFFRDNVSGGEHSAGAVARIRLFDRALSQAEIDRLGQTPAGSPCAG